MKLLILEDDSSHLQSIKNVASELNFETTYSSNYDSDKYIDYISEQDSTGVVVVDLELGELRGPAEGVNAILDMWKIDKTIVFVIFSQHIPDTRLFGPGEVCPTHIQVPKTFDEEGSLSDTSLKMLSSALSEAECIAVKLTRPVYSLSHEWESPLSELITIIENREDIRNIIIKETILEQIRTLKYNQSVRDQLSIYFQSIGNSGCESKFVGAAVFGSFGRGEGRPNSDLEVCAFFHYENRDDLNKLKDIAIMNWNRALLANLDGDHPFQSPRASMAKTITVRNGSNVKILDRDRVDEIHPLEDLHTLVDRTAIEIGLKNGFAPLLEINNLISEVENSSELNILNKSFQILVEFEPLFNAELLTSVQSSLLQCMFGECQFGRDFVRANRFKRMLDVFGLSTWVSGRIKTFAQCKAITYRVINLLTIRAALIRIGWMENWEKDRDPDFQLLGAAIAEPGIVKITRCFLTADKNGNQELSAASLEWILRYERVLQRIQRNQTEETEAFLTNFIPELKELLVCSANFFQLANRFYPDSKWISEHTGILDLVKDK